MEGNFVLVLYFIAIATVVRAVSKHFKINDSVALLIVGTSLGLLSIPQLENMKNLVTNDEFFRFTIIWAFLTALLAEATLKIRFSDMYENRKPILLLAFMGTFITYLIIGVSAVYLLNFPTEVAFAFASLMAATDPISVLSIFKNLNLDKRIAVIIEGESLLNDGLAVSLLAISIGLTGYLTAGSFGLVSMFGTLSYKLLVGVLVGVGFGIVGSWSIVPFDDYALEIMISVAMSYLSFITAEHILHSSGVIAVVTAGLIFGNYGSKIGMSSRTREYMTVAWSVIEYMASSIIFLMIGMEIAAIDLSGKWGEIGLTILIVLIARSIAVYFSLLKVKGIPSSWKHLLNFGGFKGSLSIALALGLPHNFPLREDIIILTFSVVLFSLVFQGITIKPLVKKLGLIKQTNLVDSSYETILAKKYACEVAIVELNYLKDESKIKPIIYEKLITEETQNLERYKQKLRLLDAQRTPEDQSDEMENTKMRLLEIKRDSLEELVNRNIISEKVAKVEKDYIEKTLKRDARIL